MSNDQAFIIDEDRIEIALYYLCMIVALLFAVFVPCDGGTLLKMSGRALRCAVMLIQAEDWP